MKIYCKCCHSEMNDATMYNWYFCPACNRFVEVLEAERYATLGKKEIISGVVYSAIGIEA